jgi:ABC-type transport system substrate-binding protein
MIALSYSADGPDILVESFSVDSVDPDGIYHALGKNGAIRTPYVYSEVVGDLLEEGRKIVDTTALDGHYKKVSESLLNDVPMVHLGFGRSATFFRRDRVEVDSSFLARHQGQLSFLRPKGIW